MTVVSPKLPPNAFLSDVRTYEVDAQQGMVADSDSELDELATRAVASGNPELVVEPANSNRPYRSAIAIPIYRNDLVVSVVVLATNTSQEAVGVFEIWSPVGVYEELGLSNGFFGKLSRFQNVTSFVRFEKGSGLPGQVWNALRARIHDNLSNHAGFLRAAGASADSLNTAIGVPVMGKQYNASVLMISSAATPIARGFEVWQAEPDGFTLESSAYCSDDIRLESGTKLSLTNGLLGMAYERGTAVITEDESCLLAGRDTKVGSGAVASGIAIPFFESDVMTSVTVLLF